MPPDSSTAKAARDVAPEFDRQFGGTDRLGRAVVADLLGIPTETELAGADANAAQT